MANQSNESSNWHDFPKETEHVLGESFWKDIKKIMPKKFPAIDLAEDQTTGYIFIELPGISNNNDITVSFQGQHLIIEGQIPILFQNKQLIQNERYTGYFKRSIIIPFPYQANKIQSKYENGILFITVPKTNHSYNVQVNIPSK